MSKNIKKCAYEKCQKEFDTRIIGRVKLAIYMKKPDEKEPREHFLWFCSIACLRNKLTSNTG